MKNEFINDGTSEGAKKAWESRKSEGAEEQPERDSYHEFQQAAKEGRFGKINQAAFNAGHGTHGDYVLVKNVNVRMGGTRYLLANLKTGQRWSVGNPTIGAKIAMLDELRIKTGNPNAHFETPDWYPANEKVFNWNKDK